MCYTVAFLHVRVTIVAEETQQCLIYVFYFFWLHVTANNLEILNVAQQSLIDGSTSPAIIKRTWVFT